MLTFHVCNLSMCAVSMCVILIYSPVDKISLGWKHSYEIYHYFSFRNLIKTNKNVHFPATVQGGLPLLVVPILILRGNICHFWFFTSYHHTSLLLCHTGHSMQSGCNIFHIHFELFSLLLLVFIKYAAWHSVVVFLEGARKNGKDK